MLRRYEPYQNPAQTRHREAATLLQTHFITPPSHCPFLVQLFVYVLNIVLCERVYVSTICTPITYVSQ